MKAFWHIVGAAIFTGCSSIHSPPNVALTVPPAGVVERRTFHRGDPLTDGLPYRDFLKARVPMTRLSSKGWFIEVERGTSPQVLKAVNTAKDGYDAALGWRIASSPILYARFARKTFRWGKAVSFLVQYQCDGGLEVPNNERLTYEIHGIMRDNQFTVRAAFHLTNPLLPNSRPKIYHDDPEKADSGMRRDPNYILVEQCSDQAFSPSITEIDAIIDGLKVGIPQ